MTVVQTIQRGDREVLALQSSLKPRAFAQTKLPQIISQKGLIIYKDGTTGQWNAEGTFCNTTASGEFMAVFGPSFQGLPLLSAIQGERTTAWAALHQTVSLLRNAVQAGMISHEVLKGIVQAGPEALICGDDGSLLVLPSDLYIRTLASFGIKTEMENRQLWVHPDAASIDPARALAFMAGTLAYRIIAGLPPFPHVSFDTTGSWLASLVRTELFEPLELASWKVRADVAGLVNNLLRTSVAASADPLLAFGPEYQSVLDAAKEDVPESEEFLARRVNAAKKRKALQQKREFFRKYRDAFKIGAVPVLFVGILVGTYMQDLKSKPSTLGMEPAAVVQRFYEAIGTLDQEIPRAYSMKGVKTDYEDFTANLYVTTKVRETYERNGGVLSPAELFLRKETAGRTIFGATGVDIRETASTGQERIFEVSLYLWMPSDDRTPEEKLNQTQAESPLTIYRYVDTLTLGYDRDRWKVSGFTPKMRTPLEITGPEVIKAVQDGSALNQPWAPDAADISQTAERLGL